MKLLVPLLLLCLPAFAQTIPSVSSQVITGDEQTSTYLPLLKNKSVALVINQTAQFNNTLLLDSLIYLGIHVVKIFAPEHGFRGTASAGETVKDTIDAKTHLPVISLYGDHKKPTSSDLKGVDVVVYDIQDVGVRFYTYISTLQYVMEACADNHVSFLLLDHPDPNGFYVDGPILNKKFASFVGLQPIPIVYGMTDAEYAKFLTGERLLGTRNSLDLNYILCKNYNHNTLYTLPIHPSPNLLNMTAVYLYPSVCLFEGTPVSVGRGTAKPFELIGFPGCLVGKSKFTPISTEGAMFPLYEKQICSGYDLSDVDTNYMKQNRHLFLQWLIDMYNAYPDKDKFFNDYFDELAGTDELRQQIQHGLNEQQIRDSWMAKLNTFKEVRKKYLLYKDFE
jgi:uncharacterized protein YbbC (DUF1343 family)